MITWILIDIAFHISLYEDIFTKINIHLGVHISEYLSLQMQIMYTIIQYDRVYKKNARVDILRDQILQQNWYKNLNKYKAEIKGSFYGIGFALDPVLWSMM